MDRGARGSGGGSPLGVAFEHQQALLIDELRRAAGRPVSFEELRLAGVEFPASVVSELELAGVELERCYTGPGGERRMVGVRLDPTRDPGIDLQETPPRDAQARPLDPSTSWSSRHVYRASSVPHVGGRMVALVALLAFAGVLAAVLAVALATGAGHGHATVAGRSGRPAVSGPTKKGSGQRGESAALPTAGPVPHSGSVPVSPGLATNLEARGHDMLLADRYRGAVPVLERAVAATGERLSACVQPTSDVCLTYAYALYDLGRALRLSGQASAAVPVLERRLQIDNQRPVVAAELALARRQSS